MRAERLASRRSSPMTRWVYATYQVRRTAMPRATSTTGARRRISLAENVGAEVGLQRGGHADGAVRLLVMFEQADDRAREGDARPVQGVDEARLLSGRRPIADVRAARLEVEEVGAGRHLEPLPHPGGEDLEVVRLRAGEARVAAGEEKHAVRELEELEDALGVLCQLLVLRGA